MFKFKMFSVSLVAILLFGFCSCEGVIDIPEGSNSELSKVYLPSAIAVPNRIVLQMADSTQSVVYRAYVGGYEVNKLDIKVDLGVVPALVDSFNLRNNTSYDLLPEGTYSLTNSTNIAKGKFGSEPMSIAVNPVGANLTLFKHYLLPVSITGVSNGVKMDDELNTSYFLIQPSLNVSDFPKYDRTVWQVAGFSTEEPAEGAPNGLATAFLDGNKDTFWHSKWAGGEAPMPHWVSIDLGESQEIHGLSIVARQNGTNSGKPKDVTIEFSDDGQSWTNAGELLFEDVVTEQNVFLNPPFKTARYFKFTVTSSHGDRAYTHLAELNLF